MLLFILLCVGAEAFGLAMFGQGEGPILLDNVICNGNDERLENCPSNGFGVNNCEHSEDAGVRCMSAAPGGNFKTHANSSALPSTALGFIIMGVFRAFLQLYYISWHATCKKMCTRNYRLSCILVTIEDNG